MPTRHTLNSLWWLIHKDLARELRAQHVWPGMVLLGLVLVFLLATQIDLPLDQKTHVAGGLLWLAIFFAGTLACDRSFTGEREAGCWQSLALYPRRAERVVSGKDGNQSGRAGRPGTGPGACIHCPFGCSVCLPARSATADCSARQHWFCGSGNTRRRADVRSATSRWLDDPALVAAGGTGHSRLRRRQLASCCLVRSIRSGGAGFSYLRSSRPCLR